jgi:hypothetical protein
VCRAMRSAEVIGTGGSLTYMDEASGHDDAGSELLNASEDDSIDSAER